MERSEPKIRWSGAAKRSGDRELQKKTRNSSGDEIANVNFLYDDIVHAVKIQ